MMYHTTPKPVRTTTGMAIFVIVSALTLIITSTMIIVIIQPAYALTRYFNCTTNIANRTHDLTLQDVNYCYDKEFPRSGH
jgi:hypothetical protein